MEIIVVLLIVGFAAHKLFKFNTALGAETVKAYVFMGGIKAGETVDDCNRVASYDVANGPTDVIIGARNHITTYYGGKQLPLLRDAFASGMTSNLPLWYQSFAGFDTARHIQARLRPAQTKHAGIKPA